MGNDLNFDELDQAVSNYMQKSNKAVGQPSQGFERQYNPENVEQNQGQVNVAPNTPESSLPVSSSKAPEQVKTLTGLSGGQTRNMPSSSANSRLQVQSRQTMTPKSTRSETFHDISPPTRRSSAAVTKQLAPIEGAEKPAAAQSMGGPAQEAVQSMSTSSQMPSSKPSVDSSQSIDNSEFLPQSVITQDDTATASTTKQPSETTALDSSKESTATPMPDMSQSLKDKIEFDTGESEKPAEVTTDEAATVMETNFTPPEAERTNQETPDQATPVSSPPEAEEKPLAGDSGLNLIEEPSPIEKSESDAKPGFFKDSSEHMLGSGQDNKPQMLGATHVANQGVSFDEIPEESQKPVQVFDTKEYHTPISPGSAKKEHQTFWLWVVIVLITIALLIGAYIVYTLFFATM